jgi:DNA-binding Xre family transcriptional regulator
MRYRWVEIGVVTIHHAQIRVKLKEAMEAYRHRTGLPLTLSALAKQTGMSEATLKSLSARDSYNTRLSTIARLCAALGCKLDDLLELGGLAEE